MANQVLPRELDRYVQLGPIPIPLRPRAREPSVRRGNGWSPTLQDLERWAARAVMRNAPGKQSSVNDKKEG
jgi:hypothetical protein